MRTPDPLLPVEFLQSCRSHRHSITLSALLRSDCGMVSPNALAVFTVDHLLKNRGLLYG